MSGIARLPTPPKYYDQRDQAELRRAIETFLASVQGLFAETGSASSSGGAVSSVFGRSGAVAALAADYAAFYAALSHTHSQSEVTGLVAALAAKQATLARGTVTKTTASLANNAEEASTVTLAKSGLILKVVADRACWVRLYGTASERTSDAARLITQDPGNVAVLADLVFDAGHLTINCAPLIGYANRDGTPATTLYYSIINKSGSTSTVQVDFTHQSLES